MDKAPELMGWTAAWAWGLPLIVLAAVVHVSGLWLFTAVASRIEDRLFRRGTSYFLFVMVLGTTVLFVTTMHALEAMGWAVAYIALGALPNINSAMLYSLNAITTYGHDNADLAPHWRLMGALEALNGLLLFGLTTAFLFAVAQRVWPLNLPERAHRGATKGR